MHYVLNFGIVCLAELIKWSSPWYLREMIAKCRKRLRPYLLLVVTMLCCGLSPLFEKTGPSRESASRTMAPLFTPTEFVQEFPTPEELKPQVALWKDIFTRYDSRQVIIHDSWDFRLVYAVIDLDKTGNITAILKKYRRILQTLARKEKKHALQTLTPEETDVYRLFTSITAPEKFKKAAARPIRIQSGQRDLFLEALRRSGLYQQQFARIFQESGLPPELLAIPFVESYFKYNAYSQAGAAGVWQFMPATARMYGLQMNQAVDERYDPFKSTLSAAKLLKANYAMFRSWPFAITAYNHGPAGLLKAIKQIGTADFGKIASAYQGHKFGFYSRNYYAQFLAVAAIMRNPQRYFGEFECFPTLHYEEVTIPRQMFIDDLATLLAIPKDQLAALNRGLKHVVVQSKAPVPRNFVFKLPPGKKQQLLVKLQE